LGKRTSRGIAALGGVVAIGVIASGPAGASSTGCGGGTSGSGGGISPTASPCATTGYVNPIRGKAWMVGRTDMGVDYSVTRHKPIVAIGDAKIRGSDHNSGWPGGHFLYYKLLDGSHAKRFVFVAETMSRMLPEGTVVSAGERIATALPGGTGTEWGWANRQGEPRAAPCYSEGMKTNSGMEMARFLRHLGAKTADKPGPGPDWPTGKRC
jgi:hypothetical protein